MRKIITVLLLNFLRSAKESWKMLLGLGVAIILLVAMVGVMHDMEKVSPGAINQQANVSSVGGVVATPAADTRSGATPRSKLKTRSNPGNSAPATQDAKIPAMLQLPSNTPNNTGPATTPAAVFEVKGVTLDDAVAVCREYKTAYAMQKAHVSFTTDYHGSGTVRWYWETRVDGAEATDEPPISSQIYTENVTAGTQELLLGSPSSPEPLVTAPANSTYSYRFRLHIVGPTDVVSDWVSVPLVLDSSCQSS